MLVEAVKLNQEVLKNIQISSQENMIIKSLEKFYEDIKNINLFIPIISSESNISIRLIDHFVTKYSKNNKVTFKIKEGHVESQFNVHTSYKQQLKAFQKKHFDPFSRGDRIPYFMDDTCIITTIGQLNFFKWFISKNIYDYIKDHQDDIEQDMNKKNRIEKKKEKKETKKKIKKPYNNIQTTNYTPYKPYYNQISMSEPKTNKIIVSFSFN
jgi:peptide subunit release factor 1 (eRF1)